MLLSRPRGLFAGLVMLIALQSLAFMPFAIAQEVAAESGAPDSVGLFDGRTLDGWGVSCKYKWERICTPELSGVSHRTSKVKSKLA